jgi:hypothetical protein
MKSACGVRSQQITVEQWFMNPVSYSLIEIKIKNSEIEILKNCIERLA